MEIYVGITRYIVICLKRQKFVMQASVFFYMVKKWEK